MNTTPEENDLPNHVPPLMAIDGGCDGAMVGGCLVAQHKINGEGEIKKTYENISYGAPGIPYCIPSTSKFQEIAFQSMIFHDFSLRSNLKQMVAWIGSLKSQSIHHLTLQSLYAFTAPV